MKLGWKLQQGSNDLWSRVLIGKYGRGVTNLNHAPAKSTDSSLWKAIASVLPWLAEKSCRAIGDGRDTLAWEECWIANGIRIINLDVDIPPNLRNMTVSNLASSNGGWCWNLISWLPDHILNMLVAIPAPSADNGKDLFFWPSEKHGGFTVSSAYEMLMEHEPCAEENIWKRIWNLQVPERVKCFIWLLKHGRLLTNFRKSRMHLGPPFCSFCGDVIETELHVLRDCAQCMNVWLVVVNNSVRERFFNLSFQQWIVSNLNGEFHGEGVEDWSSFWAQACHSLWYWRNKENHVDNFFRPSEPIQFIKKRTNDYRLACKADRVIHLVPKTVRQVKWLPPVDGWVALNTDGAGKDEENHGCGGLIRGRSGEWLGGFAKGLGNCNTEVAELWGAWEGLNLAWNLGYRKVDLRLDAMSVVKTLNQKKAMPSFGWNLCKRIWRIMELDWEVHISHTYRKGNLCADALAHMGSNLGSDLMFYECCPHQIRNLVSADALGTTVPRLAIM
ncbi:TMV resistance protein N [Trifolium repens]|nr:TMV resistance protein N [Trifolium repens]